MSWDLKGGWSNSTQVCTRCCDGAEEEFTKEEWSLFISGRLNFRARTPTLVVVVRGRLELRASGSLSLYHDCDGNRVEGGCLSLTFGGNVKACLEAFGVASGCVGLRGSVGGRNCGDGWNFTGNLEAFGEACFGFGLYCDDISLGNLI